MIQSFWLITKAYQKEMGGTSLRSAAQGRDFFVFYLSATASISMETPLGSAAT